MFETPCVIVNYLFTKVFAKRALIQGLSTYQGFSTIGWEGDAYSRGHLFEGWSFFEWWGNYSRGGALILEGTVYHLRVAPPSTPFSWRNISPYSLKVILVDFFSLFS